MGFVIYISGLPLRDGAQLEFDLNIQKKLCMRAETELCSSDMLPS